MGKWIDALGPGAKPDSSAYAVAAFCDQKDAELQAMIDEMSKSMRIDIERNFTYHTPTPEQLEKYALIRKRCGELGEMLQDICPDSRERSVAMTNLEQVAMWANASIAREGK